MVLFLAPGECVYVRYFEEKDDKPTHQPRLMGGERKHDGIHVASCANDERTLRHIMVPTTSGSSRPGLCFIFSTPDAPPEVLHTHQTSKHNRE